ncbi:MAG: 4-hydroxy-3-methylbut-2-enyl diphosphate reductase [Planctomycetaceae bacterium]|jgi:4-hydroxy-3-methylbut-2-enyl diphosphate reductase|nr:4-hydroxy-3-methylbut-2-enyl diphosphate reductase [Planctomycetaceae bacterium]
MRIILVNPRGFCAGVNMAVKALDAALRCFGQPVYVYHEIVHNTWVVDYFRQRGACFVDSIDNIPVGSRLMFSAHGVSPQIRALALKRNIKTIDATCPLVNSVHQAVIRYASQGYSIILIGHRGHDEVNGTMSEAPESIQIVENEQEIADLSFRQDAKLVYLTQTTLSVDETAKMIQLLRQRFPAITGHSDANICYATQNRQNAVRELSIGVDVVLVVGSRTSSNSRRLAELAKSLGICSYLVDGPNDIESDLFQGNETILITAGASAPEQIVQDCVRMLQNRFHATIEEKTTCKESLAFRLPKELTELKCESASNSETDMIY